MENRIYLYPMTSCETKKPCSRDDIKCGAISSNCSENVVQYSSVMNPCPSDYSIAINPQVRTDNYAKTFGLTNCKCSPPGNPTYFSWDPRLFDPVRGHITLDVPPVTQGVKLANVYDENLRNYGKISGGYNTISDGDIVYYSGVERQEAPFRPIFMNNSQVDTFIYRDPMDSCSPVYTTGQDKWVSPVVNNVATSKPSEGYGLTEITDINFIRREAVDFFSSFFQQRVSIN